MSEWTPVIAVFWALWALDGLRFGARQVLSLRAGGAQCGRWHYSRWMVPGALPTTWRIATSDIPFSVSPAGIGNRPAGCAGRPAETVATATAWRWEDIREVGVAKGWVFVNGVRFYPDTGHLPPRELLALAQLDPRARARRIEVLLVRWFRAAHLRRRARVLVGRTRILAALNTFVFVFFVALSIYVLADVPSRLTEPVAHRAAALLPGLLLGALLVHLTGVIIAWRTVRRLRVAPPDRRGAALFSALLLPPQAMRLRALLGEGFFPAGHPFAVGQAFTRQAHGAELAFNTLADLRWPIQTEKDSPLAAEIAAWFRAAVAERLRPLLRAAGVEPETMLAAPAPESPASCLYCPRCRDQFVAGRTVCPHGVTLLPLRK